MMKIIETKRLILRTWDTKDVMPMTLINQDPQVCKFLPTIGDREITEKMINKFIKHYENHGFCLYAVELKSTQSLLGFVGLNVPSFSAHFMPAIEIGWRLSSNYWNQGYATEAASAVLDYAFNKLKLDEIVSFTVINNLASRRVMEKIGLHHDPKDDFEHPNIEKDSPLCKHVLYRIKRNEYFQFRSKTNNQQTAILFSECRS